MKLQALLLLLIIYLVWGSTFLAIRIAVGHSEGFEPFMMAGMRNSIAGIALLLWAFFSGSYFKINLKEFCILALSGICIWTLGNGLVTFAEKNVNSGYAALVFGLIPIWITLIELLVMGKKSNTMSLLSLVLGILGLAILVLPSLLADNSHFYTLPIIALVIGSISWSSGTILQRQQCRQIPMLISSAYQLLIGGITLLIISWAKGESFSAPNSSSWWALSYLIIIGSIVGFSAYVKALKVLPSVLVGSFGYVTPLVAIALGYLVLNESLAWNTTTGGILILAAVVGLVFSQKKSCMAK